MCAQVPPETPTFLSHRTWPTPVTPAKIYTFVMPPEARVELAGTDSAIDTTYHWSCSWPCVREWRYGVSRKMLNYRQCSTSTWPSLVPSSTWCSRAKRELRYLIFFVMELYWTVGFHHDMARRLGEIDSYQRATTVVSAIVHEVRFLAPWLYSRVQKVWHHCVSSK